MKKVLMIDDEVSFTQGVKLNLEETGNYQVTVVDDSRNAIDRVREIMPDIILLDIVMPGLDGGDVIKLLEADEKLPLIPVLVVTAMLHPEVSGEGLIETGDISMLAKPVRTRTLIQCIEKIMAESDSTNSR